ncbi:MAG TPA: adenylate kinase family protein [archaeon]|nr:adenylate kinase family protein [archaeon]
MIISVSGTPKTGKTSVAKALARKLGWRLVSLNMLASQKKLYMGYDRARKSRIVDIPRLRTEVRRLSKINRNMILESHYSHDMPCDVVVILRTNPGELRRRMRRAGWSKKKIEENLEAEIMEIVKGEALEKARKVLEIDTTGKEPEWVVEQIVRRLKLGKKPEP